MLENQISNDVVATIDEEKFIGSRHTGAPNHATHDSSWDLDNLAVEVDWKKKRTYWLAYGPCNRITIRKIAAKISKCSTLLVAQGIYQPVSVQELASENTLKKLLDSGRLIILDEQSVEKIANKSLELININEMDGWKPILPAHILRKYPEEIRTLFRVLSAGINAKALRKSTLLHMSSYFLRNTFINAPLANRANPLEQYKDAIKDRPAILVAAGPSLNKQIDILSQNQDLFTIIAVDTVWPILHKHSIRPDIMFTLDPKSKVSWAGQCIDEETHFFIDIGCSPDVVWSHGKNHVFTACNPLISRPAFDMGAKADFLRTGGSVATTAFSMARYLGANPIVLIGQDLALTGGKDHADGYLYSYSRDSLNKSLESGFDVEAYHGGTVKTTKQFLFYKTWYEHQLATMDQSTMVINATEGGAKIKGALQIGFSDVCAQIRLTSLRKQSLPTSGTTAIRIDHLETLHRGIEELQHKMSSFKDVASRGAALAKAGVKPSNKLFTNIDSINEELKSYDPTVKLLVDAHGALALEKVRYTTHIRQNLRTKGDVLTKYKETYESILAATDKALAMLTSISVLYEKIHASGHYDPKYLEETLERA